MSILQTWLLYKNAISSGVAIDDILKYARRTKDAAPTSAATDDSVSAINELRKLISAQEATIRELLEAQKMPISGQGSTKNSIPRSASKVHFEDEPATINLSKVDNVPVRKPFASNSASRLEEMDGVSESSPERRTKTESIPIGAIKSVTTRNRPGTPHAYGKEVVSSSASPRQTTFSSISVDPAPRPCRSFGSVPEEEKSALSNSRSPQRKRNTEDGCRPSGESLGFSFKIPDALPPRAKGKDNNVDDGQKGLVP